VRAPESGNGKGRVQRIDEGYWFPGRWLGGASMIVGPIVFLLGILLRIRFHFFFPQQLEAYDQHPLLVSVSYNCFLAGNILLWPAVATLAKMIGETKPGWAVWGGAFVMFGLFARTFHAGADYLAFQMVRIQGVETATKTVAASYGAFHIVSALNGTILFGWILLAIGAYLSGTLGPIRSIALASMSALMMGVLKGSSLVSVVVAAGLCVAMVPLGVKLIRRPPLPTLRSAMGWLALVIAVITALFILGQLG